MKNELVKQVPMAKPMGLVFFYTIPSLEKYRYGKRKCVVIEN